MAVEIFTTASGASEAKRVFGSSVSLSGPADVHFGANSPGVAYFEKAGSDLRVVLLDGQQVMVHDFFVIGPDGGASRLLSGAGGAVEVTGLLAPEPFQPERGVIEPQSTGSEGGAAATASAPAETTPAAPAGPDSASGGAAGEGATEAAPVEAATQGGVATFLGVGLDQLAFGSALGAILGEFIASGDGGGSASASASAETAPVENVDVAGLGVADLLEDGTGAVNLSAAISGDASDASRGGVSEGASALSAEETAVFVSDSSDAEYFDLLQGQDVSALI